MKEFKAIVNELKEMNVENKLYSKVTTNRNWGIQILTSLDTGKRFAITGRWNNLNHEHQLTEIKEQNIRTYAFTYKKDFKEMIKVLEENGMEVF